MFWVLPLVWAQDVQILSRDEQYSSTVMAVPRIQIQNTGSRVLSGIQVRYHIGHSEQNLAPPEMYYPSGMLGYWEYSGSLATLVVDIPDAWIQPNSIYPDPSGPYR